MVKENSGNNGQEEKQFSRRDFLKTTGVAAGGIEPAVHYWAVLQASSSVQIRSLIQQKQAPAVKLLAVRAVLKRLSMQRVLISADRKILQHSQPLQREFILKMTMDRVRLNSAYRILSINSATALGGRMGQITAWGLSSRWLPIHGRQEN